jgi:RNA polymerase primary sigma factor
MGTRNAMERPGEAVERRLLRKASVGDRDARRRVIEAHLGMVSALARRYARGWQVPYEDLAQEGALALVQAVDRYDPSKGMKLSTYATWWVKQAIRRAAMAQSCPVRIPERLWARAGEPSGAEWPAGSRSGQEDRVPVGASGWSDAELEEVRRALRPTTSLEAPVGDGACELGEMLPDAAVEDPAEVCARSDARRRLADALACLPERERAVLSGRSGFDGQPQSLATIGKRLGVSRERARQIEGAALKELRGRRKELGLEGLVA